MRRVGIIGGTGWMGSALAKCLLRADIPLEQLWISNRSGIKVAGLEGDVGGTGVHYTTDSQALVDGCDVVVLSVRPQQFHDMSITLHSQLLISLMAGVSCDQIAEKTQATSIVRAMPNAAIEIGESYTPWYSRYLPLEHHQWTQQILAACGTEQVLPTEADLSFFTALTGSGQGVLGCIASSMVDVAQAQGVTPEIAEAAIRQLFCGIGQLMAQDKLSPSDRVKLKLDYAGTTAAAIEAMQQAGIVDVIRAAIEAAFAKAASEMMND